MKNPILPWFAVAALSCALAGPALADPQKLVKDRGVQAALAALKAVDARTFAEQREISEIPAPPFGESVRAEDYRRRFEALGLKDVRIDAEGNVIGRRPGAGKGPTLVLSAHLDTVFPVGTDVKVTERDGRFYGAGLADDARGLAVLLSVARALDEAKIATTGDILFVGTVGEEGLGDLRGAKALLRDQPGVDGFISVDGVNLGSVVNQGTGSKRWRFTFKGPGGHSFGNFGRPTATHALGRAIAGISDLKTPAEPKTTFNVGTVKGGTSVNAIAAEASLELDMRSNGVAELQALEAQAMAAVDRAVAEENARWNATSLTVEKTLIGDRPAGLTPPDGAMVRAAVEAATTLGQAQPKLVGSSTDSNVAMSLGIPAVTLAGGGEGGDAHGPSEWYRPTEAWRGAQHVLLTVLDLVGVQKVSPPRLPSR